MADETQTTQNTEQPADKDGQPAKPTEAPAAAEKKFSQKELDDIVKQRLERAAKGQPSKEELAEFRRYKDSLKTEEEKRSEQQHSLEEATGRISALEKELTLSRVGNMLHEQAASLGIDPSAVPYVVKLADLSDVLDDSGAPDGGKIKAAVDKVLSDIPALKVARKEKTGFVPIGSDNANSELSAPEDEKLRRAFGLKAKK
nr:MAG TPA: Major capsid protein [Caudoviricetes sp.]